MKLCHNITITVFSKIEENEERIKETLLQLFPFRLEEEKIRLNRTTAIGFNEKKIGIYEVVLKKDKHINYFLKSLNEKLSPIQKEMLVKQANSRLDNELFFFIRLDKEKLINNEFWITDSGNCYHIKMSVACFPKKKDAATKIIKEIFK